MEETNKAYLVYSKTLKELEELARSIGGYSEPIYEYVIDRSDLSKKQKETQENNKWNKKQRHDFYLGEEELKDVIRKCIYEELLGGCRGGLKEVVYRRVMDTETKVLLRPYTNYAEENKVGCVFVVGDCDKELENRGLEEVDDTEELEKRLKSLKVLIGPSTNHPTVIYTEKVEVYMHSYRFKNLSGVVWGLINKFFKENLTYCIKNDVVIIPEEYIKRGQEGINEWREKKKKKNNSIEKQILRQAVKDKKEFAIDALGTVMREMCDISGRRWDIPWLIVDGRFNKQKVAKLMTQINETTKRQQFMNMTNEEIVNRTKEYWKNMLKEAYNRIDELEIGE